MPKIQLSALATDVKGKAQGSVFSSNSGGLYFRSGKTSKKQNSIASQQQRNKFSQLASSYRNLTPEQQAAWEAARSVYPTVNAFGTSRLPSAYELFMRLNGALTAQGFQALLVPAMPRETPVTGLLELDYPEYYQFNPMLAMDLARTDSLTLRTTIVMDGIFQAFKPNRPTTISFRIKPLPALSSTASLAAPAEIFSIIGQNADYLKLQIVGKNQSNIKMVLVYHQGPFTASMGLTVPAFEFSDNAVIVIQTTEDTAAPFTVHVNSTDYSDTYDIAGTPVFQEMVGTGYIGDPLEQRKTQMYVSDFRYYKTIIGLNELDLIKWGYVLPYNSYYLPMTYVLPGNELEQIPSDLGTIARLQLTEPVQGSVAPVSFGLVPLFTIYTENYGATGWNLNIYASPPISTGRNGSLSNFKLIASKAWRFVRDQQVYGEIRELYGNIPADSQVRFYVQHFDTTTGQLDRNKMEVKPRKPRFKTGSELTDKVN